MSPMPEPRRCPICKRVLPEGEAARFHPFCSKRCSDIDLGRWLKGAYAIPATETDDTKSDTPEGQDEDDENGVSSSRRH